MNKELSDDIYDKIEELTDRGNDLCDEEKWAEAIKVFSKALELLPDPKEEWEAATWIYAALGDTYFFMKKYEDCLEQMKYAMMCPDGLGNPFICIRMAECYYELKNFKKADEYFFETYMLEGLDIFEHEENYKEYVLNFLKEKGEI